MLVFLPLTCLFIYAYAIIYYFQFHFAISSSFIHSPDYDLPDSTSSLRLYLVFSVFI